MNVLVVSYHCCIRVIKQAIALMGAQKGINLIFLQSRIANTEFETLLHNMSFYGSEEQLEAKLVMLSGAGIDLIVVHNEPDWMVTTCKRVLPGIPLIMDCHDLATMKDVASEGGIAQEIEAFKNADAYVFVSEGYEKAARKFHNVPDSKPSIVLHSYCNIPFTMLEPLPKMRGVVYEGNLVAPSPTPGGLRISEHYPWYRDHRELSDYLHDHNIPLALYGVSMQNMATYTEKGALCFPAINYTQMVQNLSRWDWGFVGATQYTKTMENAMPNKMFEYIAAGIPVIVCNAEEAGKWVEENGLGINVYSMHEIPEIYEQHIALRKNVEARRREFTMETQVDGLIDFYHQVAHV